MKKGLIIFALLILVVSVSACTTKKESAETVAPFQVGSEENNNLVEDNNIVTPNAATSLATGNNSAVIEQPIASEAATEDTNKNMIDPKNFSDLTKEYSQALIKTSAGDIQVKFYGSDSPFTVNNFLNLAKAGFYNGTRFHRVIKDFMIQGGDPLSKGDDSSVYGTGGPGYQFKDEFNTRKLVAGSLAMANSGPDTNGSQFFIVTLDATPRLDGKHTNFGEVVSGMDIVKKIEAAPVNSRDLPVEDIKIISIELMK
jgi:cyclophilin family peptidyl-prolyl cis-trans isomerase